VELPNQAPNQRRPSAHANQTRKAGLPAPRVACLSCLHKADSRSTQVAQSALLSNAASEPSSRSVPAIASICMRGPDMASLVPCSRLFPARLEEMAGAAGLEPATCGFGDLRPVILGVAHFVDRCRHS